MSKILIVDDEEDIRNLFKEILTQAGFTCDTAIDGVDCIAKLKKNTYDLVLMDMFMPGMSGRETLEKINRNPNIKDNKVAFLTVAHLGKKGKEGLKELGAVDFINKPIDAVRLVQIVKKLVDNGKDINSG